MSTIADLAASTVQWRKQEPKWVRSDLTFPFSDEDIRFLQESVAQIRFVVDAVGELAIGALEAADAFIKATVNPTITALILALRELRDLFQGLLDAGVFATFIIPTPAKLFSAEECLALLAASLLDKNDKNRPITVNTAREEVCIFTLVLRLPDLRLLDDLYDAIRELLKLPEFPRYRAALDRLGEDVAKPSPGKGFGTYPDWHAGRLVDAIPALGDALRDVIETIDLLIQLVSTNYALFEDILAAIRKKLDAINKILAIIEGILAGIELILSANYLTGLFIWGAYTAQELSTEIMGSIATIPGYDTTEFIPDYEGQILPQSGRFSSRYQPGSPPNIGAAISFCAVGPNADTLAYIFGQGTLIADQIVSTPGAIVG